MYCGCRNNRKRILSFWIICIVYKIVKVINISVFFWIDVNYRNSKNNVRKDYICVFFYWVLIENICCM